MLKEGSTAPAFTTSDAEDERFSSKIFAVKKSFLYFYPKRYAGL